MPRWVALGREVSYTCEAVHNSPFLAALPDAAILLPNKLPKAKTQQLMSLMGFAYSIVANYAKAGNSVILRSCILAFRPCAEQKRKYFIGCHPTSCVRYVPCGADVKVSRLSSAPSFF